MRIIESIINSRIVTMIFLLSFLPCNALNGFFVAGKSIYYYLHLFDCFIFFAILAIIIVKSNKYKFSKPTWFGIVMIVWLSIMSFINSGNQQQVPVAIIIQWITFVVNTSYYLLNNEKKTIECLYILFFSIMIPNVFYQIFNNGAWGYGDLSGNAYNFFQSDNFSGYYYISALGAFILYEIKYVRHIQLKMGTHKLKVISGRLALMLSMMIISILISWSATCVAGFFLFLAWTLLIIILKNRFSEFIFNYKFVISMFVIMFLVLVVFQSKSILLSFITQTVLKKDVTFSGRSGLWSQAILMSGKKLLIGYGLSETGRTYVGIIGNTLYSAHNLFLEFLLQGGIGTLIIYLEWCFMAIKSAYNRKTIEALILMACIVCEMIMFIFEGTTLTIFPHFIFILCAESFKR